MAAPSARRPCRADSSAIVSVANMVSSMTGRRLSDDGEGRQLFAQPSTSSAVAPFGHRPDPRHRCLDLVAPPRGKTRLHAVLGFGPLHALGEVDVGGKCRWVGLK